MVSKGSVLMERYEMGKLLGQGNFAKVYHARDIKAGSSVAIKIIDKAKILKIGMMEHVEAEISVMKLVRHPNVVQLFEVMATKSKIYLVMEYVRGGELFDEVAKGKMKEEAARKYFQQLISAVDFCHSRGVYHRDLKPENLLIDENGELKISDFGLSVLVGSEQRERLLHTMCGTPAYVAPEVIRGRGYEGSMADIWSCGVILFVLLSGRHPFHDANIMEMYRKIGMAEFKYPNRFPSSARRLISKILDPNPNTRIPTSKIVESSWFRRGLKSKVSRSASLEVVVDTDVKPSNLNAFEIISLSAGFDLSGLFEGSDERKETKFMSTKPAKTIISKIEEIAGRLKMKAWKKDGGHLKFEGSKEGRKGVVGIDVEIFEVSNNFHVVEMKKSNGDTLEYGRLMKEEVRPCLKDIVWTWQGQEAPPLEQQE